MNDSENALNEVNDQKREIEIDRDREIERERE